MRLYGKNPVIERLKSDPQSIRKIYLQSGHDDAGYIHRKARKWGIPVYVVPKSKIQKMARSANTQGVLADVGDFPYLAFQDLLETALKKDQVLVFLDGLNDPQNLGAIIRSLACIGGFALVLPTHHSVEVTETVLRIACGGENFIRIAKVSNLSQAVRAARESGFWIAGSVVKGGEDLSRCRLQFPLGLVVGSEQKGVRDVIRKQLDLCLTIPMAQARLAMNVAHAASVLCYEIRRQRGKGKG